MSSPRRPSPGSLLPRASAPSSLPGASESSRNAARPRLLLRGPQARAHRPQGIDERHPGPGEPLGAEVEPRARRCACRRARARSAASPIRSQASPAGASTARRLVRVRPVASGEQDPGQPPPRSRARRSARWAARTGSPKGQREQEEHARHPAAAGDAQRPPPTRSNEGSSANQSAPPEARVGAPGRPPRPARAAAGRSSSRAPRPSGFRRTERRSGTDAGERQRRPAGQFQTLTTL